MYMKVIREESSVSGRFILFVEWMLQKNKNKKIKNKYSFLAKQHKKFQNSKILTL
jgi:hypothetical protein